MCIRDSFYDRDADDLPQRWIGMLRHTMSTLGPKVLATRMVRDYTEKLYTPTARSNAAVRADGYAGARDLAAYKAKVHAAWPSISVDHVEAHGLSDSPQVGETLHVDAYVRLDGLEPSEVDVQVVTGTAAIGSDDLSDWTATSLSFVERYHDGITKYSGQIAIERTGQFGYTVRVLPQHEQLAFQSSLGLVANA